MFLFNNFIQALARLGLLNWISDEKYLKLMFYVRIGKKLDLSSPKTYNEKLQWLKIYDFKPEYCQMVDKYEAKKYVAEIIGEEYIIPTLGVWNDFDDIDFSLLPNQFVLKCTHDSGGLIICKNKANLNLSCARKKINRSLKKNYFWTGREMPYKSLKPRILAEKFMVDETGDDLRDYKVMCFNGEPKIIEFHSGRYTDHQTQVFYNTKWEKLSYSQEGKATCYKVTNKVNPPPSSLNEMLRLSAILAKGIKHIRVDWYSINGKLYFGELTFFDGSGFVPFDNLEDDLEIGNLINLENE